MLGLRERRWQNRNLVARYQSCLSDQQRRSSGNNTGKLFPHFNLQNILSEFLHQKAVCLCIHRSIFACGSRAFASCNARWARSCGAHALSRRMRASPRLVGYLTVHRVADNSMLEADPATLALQHINQPFSGSKNLEEPAVAGFVDFGEPAFAPWQGGQHCDGRFSEESHLERMEEGGDVENLVRVTNRGDECSEEVIALFAMGCEIALQLSAVQVQDEVHPETGEKEQEDEKHVSSEEKKKEGKIGEGQDGEGEEAFHGFPQSPETDAPEYLEAISRESSTRELVLAAITVMKGRKARPDTRRLCNWVHRKYGRPVQVKNVPFVHLDNFPSLSTSPTSPNTVSSLWFGCRQWSRRLIVCALPRF